MQQRREPPDSLEYFPTQAWATRALCERLAFLSAIGTMTAWECACGEGHMARPLSEYFAEVVATDVHDYSAGFPDQHQVSDFLIDWDHPHRFADVPADWIITNPPFRLAERFIKMALRLSRFGVAMFVRSAFLEGIGRYNSVFSRTPPSLILQFTERVPLVKGRVDPKVSSATAYCWLVWRKDYSDPTQFEWIAPCRARLERASDYPVLDPGPMPLLDPLEGQS